MVLVVSLEVVCEHRCSLWRYFPQALMATRWVLHILCVVVLMVVRHCNRRSLFCAPVVLLFFAKVRVAVALPPPDLARARLRSCFTEWTVSCSLQVLDPSLIYAVSRIDNALSYYLFRLPSTGFLVILLFLRRVQHTRAHPILCAQTYIHRDHHLC